MAGPSPTVPHLRDLEHNDASSLPQLSVDFGIRLSPLFLATLAVMTLTASQSSAVDTWTEVRPGIDLLHRTVGGGTPQDIRAVRIDLTRPEVSVRASMDISGRERRVTTSTFAENVGAVAAINGDWSDGSEPFGLAIGNGFQWHDQAEPHEWGVFGCDVFNQCSIEVVPRRADALGFEPTRFPRRYYNAVGGNAVYLLLDGRRGSGCFDGCDGDVCRHPRSAVCLDESGDELWFIVADGRRSGASGMTCEETRDLVEDLGCHDAMMLDGGGSSTLWADGSVQNRPSGGSERVLGGHLGIMWTETPDPECADWRSGAWCEGTRLRTCNGGRLVNDGDCGGFGIPCGEDGDWAFCMNPSCPGGDGMGSECTSATGIVTCVDGFYSEGDCGFFGAICSSDHSGASCADSRCSAGPNSAFCAGATTFAECTDGAYSERGCGGEETCEETGSGPACVAPEPDPEPDVGPAPDEAPDVGTPDVGTPDADAGAPDDTATDATDDLSPGDPDTEPSMDTAAPDSISPSDASGGGDVSQDFRSPGADDGDGATVGGRDRDVRTSSARGCVAAEETQPESIWLLVLAAIAARGRRRDSFGPLQVPTALRHR